MDNIIVIGSTAYLYSYVQRNGVTPLVAFGLFTIILPYVAQKLLVAPPLSGKIRSGSGSIMVNLFILDDYRTSWLATYLTYAAFLCYCAYLRETSIRDNIFCFLWATKMMIGDPCGCLNRPVLIVSGLLGFGRELFRLDSEQIKAIRYGALALGLTVYWLVNFSAHVAARGVLDSESLEVFVVVLPVLSYVLAKLMRKMDQPLKKKEFWSRLHEWAGGGRLFRYHVPPKTPSPLATDEHVALLVASRSPRASHAALAAVNRHLARTILSEKGALTLRRERLASGWCDAPEAGPRHVVPLEALVSADDIRTAGERDAEALIEPEPRYLFDQTRTPNAGFATSLLVQLLAARACDERGEDWTLSDAATRRAALVDFFVPIVSIFYCPTIFELVPYAYAPRDPLNPAFRPFGQALTDGSFVDHIAHVRRCLDFAVECYDATDCETPGTMSNYGKRMVDAGLLREVYDEPSGRFTIDADGSVIKVLRGVWSQTQAQATWTRPDDWPTEPPLDASLIVVWASLLVFRDPAAREQLMSPVRAGGLRASDVTVDGGYLLRLVIPLPGPGGQMRDPVLPNFIDLYVQMLDQLLSQQRAQYERIRERIPELRRRAPRPYPDVSDSD